MTARAKNFLWGRPDLGDTIARLKAFFEADADVLYAPGLPHIEAITTLCREVDKPVNVVMELSGKAFTIDELSRAGVRRISVGGPFARATEEVRASGTFGYAE